MKPNTSNKRIGMTTINCQEECKGMAYTIGAKQGYAKAIDDVRHKVVEIRANNNYQKFWRFCKWLKQEIAKLEKK